MVTLPSEFVATKYPGYFWNTRTRRLFTAKLGVLRELKRSGPNKWNYFRDGYKVSHEGVNRFLEYADLLKLQPKDSVFPVRFTTVKNGTNSDVPVQLSLLPEGTIVDVYIRG